MEDLGIASNQSMILGKETPSCGYFDIRTSSKIQKYCP